MTHTLIRATGASTRQFRRAKPADAGAIQRLWADHFPAREADDTLIGRAVALSRPGTVGWVCRDGSRVVGCGLQTYQDPTDLYGLPPDLLPETPHPDAVFLLTAVAPEYRREGIGRRLAEVRIAAAKSRGCGRVIGCAWQHGADMLRDLGFEHVGTVEEYFDYDPGAIKVHALEI